MLDVPTDPAHPSDPVPPLALQEVALEEDHASVVDEPTTTEFGDAEKLEMLGAGGGALVTFRITELAGPAPAAPLQVRV